MYRHLLKRFVHSEKKYPELDFTKPISDRMKRKLDPIRSNFDDERSLLKVSLRGQCLFGLYPIESALRKKRRQFYRLFISKTMDKERPLMKTIETLAEELSIPIESTTTSVLDRLSFDRPHQGVCLDCSPLVLENVEKLSFPSTNEIELNLCLVRIHDPMNLGAMIRTAHFFGVKRIFLTDGTCQPSPVASKASSGAMELMPLFHCRNVEQFLRNSIQENHAAFICARHQAEQISLRSFSLTKIKNDFSSTKLKSLVILIGNEQTGISEEISQLCHYNVSIQADSQSEISSLNASVACALFLYHFSAQLNR